MRGTSQRSGTASSSRLPERPRRIGRALAAHPPTSPAGPSWPRLAARLLDPAAGHETTSTGRRGDGVRQGLRLRAGFGADGIDELLYGFFSRARGGCRRPTGGPRYPSDGHRRHLDDPDRARPRAVTGGVGEADCVVSGPAADLYLLLWNRRTPDERFSIEGNRHLLELWRTKAVIT